MGIEYKPTKIENERRNRIRLSIAAYTYEFLNESIISDGEYDKLALAINVNVKTGHRRLDAFFKNNYDPHTGMWIRKHPDLDGLKRTYERVFKGSKPKQRKKKQSLFED
jgi:hypothetical protein